jgi:hypothetical protein
MLGFGSKYIKFWRWFEAHEEEILHLERNQEKVFDKLAAELGRAAEEFGLRERVPSPRRTRADALARSSAEGTVWESPARQSNVLSNF